MPTPRAFVTRAIPQTALDIIASEVDMEVWPEEEPPGPGLLQEKTADVQGILTNIMDRVDASLLESAPKLKVVSQMAVGLDNVDVEEATRRGIPVGLYARGSFRGYRRPAFALLLASARRVSESERWVRQGKLEDSFSPPLLAGRRRSTTQPLESSAWAT